MTHVNRWQTLCRTENFFALGLALAPLAPLGSDAIRFPNIWQAQKNRSGACTRREPLTLPTLVQGCRTNVCDALMEDLTRYLSELLQLPKACTYHRCMALESVPLQPWASSKP